MNLLELIGLWYILPIIGGIILLVIVIICSIFKSINER